MTCKICNSYSNHAFTVQVLKKYDAKYFKCNNCGYLFAEDTFWLDEAYQSSINISDTGLIDRNINFSKMLAVLIYFNFHKDGKFLDYAGGYGIFTRLMRDIGFDFYWQDIYTQNLLSKGFEANANHDTKYELVTAFEVFEHLVDPKEEITRMLQQSDIIVFSTELLPNNIPEPDKWWYYGFEHGQHISFYSKTTFTWLANYFGLKYYYINGAHLLTSKKINYSALVIEKKLHKYGLFAFVKKMMKSKTLSDSLMLKSSKTQ
jgi:hypothetical protein